MSLTVATAITRLLVIQVMAAMETTVATAKLDTAKVAMAATVVMAATVAIAATAMAGEAKSKTALTGEDL